jgi:type II secretory pathway pseudopilin PulG
VELLIVIIIVAILAAVALPRISGSKERASDSAIRAQLTTYRNAVQRFYDDTGLYPFTLDHLYRTTAPPTGLNDFGVERALNASKWHGPYMINVPSAPDNFIHYNRTSPNMGRVSCVRSGRASDGTLYTEW